MLPLVNSLDTAGWSSEEKTVIRIARGLYYGESGDDFGAFIGFHHLPLLIQALELRRELH